MNILRGIVKNPSELWIVCDMDGTLSNHEHRVYHVAEKGNESDDEEWEAYHSKMHLDKPYKAEQILLRMFYRLGFNIAICTAREEIFKEQTIEWLWRNHINFNRLYMRAEKDYRPGAEIKEEILLKKMANKKILFVLEDRESVVAMWRKNGVTCFQCRPGNGIA